MKKNFQVLADTADFKLRVFGATLNDVFRHALLGMFQGMKPQSDACVYAGNRLSCKEFSVHHAFDVDGSDISSLLVNFLSHALSLSAEYKEVYCDVSISSLSEEEIKGTFKGVPVDRFDGVSIKAVSYYGLTVKNVGDGWQVDIVFDV